MKKTKVTFLGLCILCSVTVFGQWNSTGDSKTTGNLNIGNVNTTNTELVINNKNTGKLFFNSNGRKLAITGSDFGVSSGGSFRFSVTPRNSTSLFDVLSLNQSSATFNTSVTIGSMWGAGSGSLYQNNSLIFNPFDIDSYYKISFQRGKLPQDGNTLYLELDEDQSTNDAEFVIKHKNLNVNKKLFVVNTRGNVGLGVDNPKHNLETSGNIKSHGQLIAKNLFLNGPDLCIQDPDRGNSGYGRALVHGFKNDLRINFDGDFTGGVWINGPKLTVDGKVGIGTENPQNELDVKGTIRAEEIIVETDWADFVFNKDYPLLPLEDVKNHIEEKKHLPGIPSEKEVKENGIALSEITTKMMQKIEELTLYVIQQNERTILLEKTIEIQNKRIKELEN